MAGKICAICGAPSGMYPLCVKCMKLKNEGKVIKCENCGKWHYADNACSCTPKSEPAQEIKEVPSEGVKINCLICGNDAGTKHFCKACYAKYKDHSVVIRIEKCTTAEILEKYAEGYTYTAKDGHKIRSKDEKIIDDFLFDHKILHAYEKKKYIDEEKYNAKDVIPDFYLTEQDVWIEHLGFTGDQYKKQNEFKKHVFEQEGMTVIYTYPEDISDIEGILEHKLNTYKKGQLNFWKGSK